VTTVPVRSAIGDVGTALSEVALPAELFEAPINVPVMHQVVVAQFNARRAGTRGTKTRGKVSGGGAKPYRQKGTGRARQGSIRAPHYVGGGTVFGPQAKDYTQKVPRKVRRLALASALTARTKDDRIVVVDELSFPEPKTKEAAALLRAHEIVGKVLVVVAEPDENVWRSFRNLPEAHVLPVDQLNVYDVIAREWLLFSRAAIEKLIERAPAFATRKGRAIAPSGSAAGEGGEGA